jgi:chloramphenicol-sensitive protein RarD
MNNSKHYAAAVSAFVIWGFFTLPLRALKPYGAGEILYFRILFSSLALLIIILGWRRSNLKRDWQQLKALAPQQRTQLILLTLAGGALLTVNWLTFIYIVNNINIKTASFSYLICPVITAALGYVILKEKLSALQWTAVILCGLSCVLLGINSALELGYSFLTAVTYALYLISQRKNQGFDRLVILGVQVIFSFLILNVLYGYLIHEVPVAPSFYIIITIIAVVFTVVPLFLNLFALNRINSATIGILMYINPIMNFSIAFLVFHETINSLQVVGYLVIVAALVIFNLPNFKRIQTAVTQRMS